MFSPLMLDQVCREIHGADVVAVDQGALGQQAMDLGEELAQPASLGDGVGNNLVLGLSNRPGDGVLAHGGSREQVVTEEDTIA